MKMPKGTRERFYSKVARDQKTGCFIWIGSKMLNGYGRIKVNGTNWLAHRFSWEMHLGTVPKDLCVCHHCDNPLCVNPAHLFLGTNQDNANDCVQKGRANLPKGEKHPRHRLTAKEILAIRADKRKRPLIASDYGVSSDHIKDIQRRRRWQHL